MRPYLDYTDEALVLGLQKGDHAAFTEIYHRYWERLFFTAHKRVKHAENAQEIVQQVFVQLWEKREKLNIDTLTLYLAAMTRHAVYKQWAGVQRRAKHKQDTQLSQAKVDAANDYENKQVIELFIRFADTLPHKYKVTFISYKLFDRPIDEVAEELGVSPRTAEGYVSKVMELMRDYRHEIAFTSLTLLLS